MAGHMGVSRFGRWTIITSIVFSAVFANCSASSAETLAEAMAAALQRHPSLRAEEARSRAARSAVDYARSGYYPRVTASGDIGIADGRNGLGAGSDTSVGGTGSTSNGWGPRWGYSLAAEQMLFDGWRTQSAVAEASTEAEAASYQVRATEQSVLLEAVIAFADVVRAREIERLRSRSKAMLENELKAAQERMKRGAGTETDVAQTRARHAQAIADLIAAKAEAKASVAEYERVIGHAPGKLEPPRVPEALLPKSVQEAILIAESQNAVAISAELKEQASRHTIDRVAADRLPQVKLRGGIDGEHSLSSDFDGRNSASVAVRVSVPLFDGGATSALVEQARHLNTSLAEEARAIRESIHASTTAAWARLTANRDRLSFEQESVNATRQALDGVLEEIRLGQRSTLEGLDAQRELVASEVRLAASERDLIVSAFGLLAVTGQLSIDKYQSSDIQSKSAGKGRKASGAERKAANPSWQPAVTRHR